MLLRGLRALSNARRLDTSSTVRTLQGALRRKSYTTDKEVTPEIETDTLFDTVENLEKKFQSLSTQPSKPQSPLHDAIRKGDPALLEQLAKNKALLEQRDHNGNTPLKVAVETKQPLFIFTLIRAGAKPSNLGVLTDPDLEMLQYGQWYSTHVPCSQYTLEQSLFIHKIPFTQIKQAITDGNYTREDVWAAHHQAIRSNKHTITKFLTEVLLEEASTKDRNKLKDRLIEAIHSGCGKPASAIMSLGITVDNPYSVFKTDAQILYFHNSKLSATPSTLKNKP